MRQHLTAMAFGLAFVVVFAMACTARTPVPTPVPTQDIAAAIAAALPTLAPLPPTATPDVPATVASEVSATIQAQPATPDVAATVAALPVTPTPDVPATIVVAVEATLVHSPTQTPVLVPAERPDTEIPSELGYLTIGDTVSWDDYSYTLSTVTFPDTISYDGERIPARYEHSYISTCGLFRNKGDDDYAFAVAWGILVDSDAGVGFYVGGDGSTIYQDVEAGDSQRVCHNWIVPATARVIVVAVSVAYDDIHLFRVDRP